MSTPITIHPATVTDVRALTELLAELNREEGYATSIDHQTLETILFGTDNRLRMRALIAKQNDTPLGLVLYYWGYDTVSSSHGYHLADIIVTRQARGKGIGTRLMQALAAQCLEEEGQWISLTVLKQNFAAQKFYTKLKMSQVAVDFFAIGPQALRMMIKII